MQRGDSTSSTRNVANTYLLFVLQNFPAVKLAVEYLFIKTSSLIFRFHQIHSLHLFSFLFLQGFKCPECQSGFIEEMESQPQNSYSDESSDEGDVEMVASIGEVSSIN